MAARKTRTPRTRWQRLTKRQRDEFLEHVRDGKNRKEAAALVGSTGTVFRALCEHDPRFDGDYKQALAAGQSEIGENLLAESVRRCFDPERMTDRGLHNALIYFHAGYRAAHKSGRLEHAGVEGQPLRIALDRLSDADLDMWSELLRKADPDLA